MIRVIADELGVTVVTELNTYELEYDRPESFEELTRLLEDLGFDAEYEESI